MNAIISLLKGIGALVTVMVILFCCLGALTIAYWRSKMRSMDPTEWPEATLDMIREDIRRESADARLCDLNRRPDELMRN